MKIVLWKLKSFFRLLYATFFTLLFGCVLLFMNVSRFPTLRGERTFYLYSASSQGLRTQALRFSEFFAVRGESVCFMTEFGQGRKVAEWLLNAYGAELLFTETVCGVTSYYAYTPEWSDGVYLQGKQVNLHVAFCGERVAVGSPIIFDGF